MKPIIATVVVILCSAAAADENATLEKIREDVVDGRKQKLETAKTELDAIIEAQSRSLRGRELKRATPRMTAQAKQTKTQRAKLQETVKNLERESQFWEGVLDGTYPIPHTWLSKVDQLYPVVRVNSKADFVGTYQRAEFIDGKFRYTDEEIVLRGWDTTGFEVGKKVKVQGYFYEQTDDTPRRRVGRVRQHVPDEIVTTQPLKKRPITQANTESK